MGYQFEILVSSDLTGQIKGVTFISVAAMKCSVCTPDSLRVQWVDGRKCLNTTDKVLPLSG